MALQRKPGRPSNPPPPPPEYPWEAPAIAKQVDEILIALEAPPIDAETRGIFERMLHRQRYVGGDAKGKIVLTLRCILESENGSAALVAPIVSAVSSCLTPEISERGLEMFDAFDKIPLIATLQTMRSLDLFSEKSIGHYLGIVIRNKLFMILGAAAQPASKPIKPKLEPKPPRSITRIPEIEKNIALGIELLALRAAVPGNAPFGRQARKRFPDVDQRQASQTMRVARIYAGWPEIWRAASWRTLIQLASPKMSPAVRQGFEAKIIAGEAVTAPQIRRERGKLKPGSPKRRPADQPAPRMAA